jgi:hypothetical protein
MVKEYKIPKVLEKRPVIAGFDLSSIVVLTASSLMFVFTAFKSLLLSLLFLIVAIAYVKIKKKYPRKGQVKTLIRYNSSAQCVRIDRTIIELTQKN